MARSPFQGTFQPNLRTTITTAPDALVRINGSTTVAGCPKCARRFDINKYITSIQTNLSIDSVPGSATLELSIPRHAVDDFYFDGHPVVMPMMEVEIFVKGYYLLEGMPEYYPVFWGLITQIGDAYSSGAHTISIQCADILHWWTISQVNIHPAYTGATGAQGRSIFGNVFQGTNPYDVIFTLAQQSFGDIMVGTGSAVATIRENVDSLRFKSALVDIMGWWQARFAKMRSNLVLYGTRGVALRGETLFARYPKAFNWPDGHPEPIIATAVRDANGIGADNNLELNVYGKDVVAFKTVIPNAGQTDLWTSEFQTKLEIANAAKDGIGYEFFMDVSGDIVFKPPFYNLDVYPNKPVSWIQDIDIISWDFSESDSDVVTQILMEGQYTGSDDYGVDGIATPRTSVVDYHLLRQYGWRSRPYNSEFLKTPQEAFIYGLDLLDRLNSKRHTGSVSIPIRPELRLGFPVYISPKDEMWYVTGISHNIAFGGQATTSLTLTSKRAKFIAPRGIGTLTLNSVSAVDESGDKQDGQKKPTKHTSKELAKGGIFELNWQGVAKFPDDADTTLGPGVDDPSQPLILRNPKNGKIAGYPNVVMAYLERFDPPPPAFQKTAGQSKNQDGIKHQREEAKRNQAILADAKRGQLAYSQEDYLRDRYMNNRSQYGLTSAGVFVYAHDVSKAVHEVLLLPSDNLTAHPDLPNKAHKGQTVLIRPVSDERGFEVIGHYQYGRHVSLSDGRLITNAPKDRAQVRLQLGLGGSLAEMLTSQSHGLAKVGAFVNPAKALADITPDDLNSAATLVQGKPEFVDPKDMFVSTAKMGSAEDMGFSDAEASQFSRALTLAEMAVIDTNTYPDENCVCVTGRADLAFMNSDLVVQPLKGTATEDKSTLVKGGEGPINVGAIGQASTTLQALNAQLAQTQARLDVINPQIADILLRLPTLDPVDPERLLLLELQDEQSKKTKLAAELTEKLPAAQKAYDSAKAEHSSDGNIFTRSRSETIKRVQEFLTKLYRRLDVDHQEYEAAIRGEHIPQPTIPRSGLNADQVAPKSDFAPPFFEPNRLTLGDPKAAVASIQTNAKGIAAAWKSAGQEMKSNAERTRLSQRISQGKTSIDRLKATRAQLAKEEASGTTAIVRFKFDQKMKALDEEIAKYQQQVADDELQLKTMG